MGRKIAYVLAVIAGLLALIIAWGLIEPRFLDTESYQVEVDHLSEAQAGTSVAFITDWQIGMWLDNPSTVEEAVEKIVAAEPDVALIGGDFIYHADETSDRKEAVTKAVSIAGRLGNSGIPTFAVLGNHDYGLGKDAGEIDWEIVRDLRRRLEQNGVQILRNEAVKIQPEGTDRPLYIVGLGSSYADHVDVEQAFSGVPADAPRVVVMHNPSAFEQIPANTAPLALAGHTHGGQIRVPGMPHWSWLGLVEEGAATADGWIEDTEVAGNRLYVNRGIGMSSLPLRIWCPPELTYFELMPKEGQLEPKPDELDDAPVAAR